MCLIHTPMRHIRWCYRSAQCNGVKLCTLSKLKTCKQHISPTQDTNLHTKMECSSDTYVKGSLGGHALFYYLSDFFHLWYFESKISMSMIWYHYLLWQVFSLQWIFILDMWLWLDVAKNNCHFIECKDPYPGVLALWLHLTIITKSIVQNTSGGILSQLEQLCMATGRLFFFFHFWGLTEQAKSSWLVVRHSVSRFCLLQF